MELIEKAANYAAEKANDAITNAIAQAYADGYRDGYKDREQEIPVDLRDNKTEYVDLGLPSGTLWAKDYEKKDKDYLFLPFRNATKYDLPTVEQWKELLEFCVLKGMSTVDTFCGITCIGPNGNSVLFRSEGYYENTTNCGEGRVYFWLQDDEEGLKKNAIRIGAWRREDTYKNRISKLFSGYKLPVRLVRNK